MTKHGAENVMLDDVIKDWVEKTPEMPAFRCLGKAVSYQELDQRANQLAHWLVDQVVMPGDRVAIWMH